MTTRIQRYSVVGALAAPGRHVRLVEHTQGAGVLASVRICCEDAAELVRGLVAARSLYHAGSLPMSAHLLYDGRHAFVYPAVRGTDVLGLVEYLRVRRRRLNDAVVYHLGATVAESLRVAHSAGALAHGLLSPRHTLLGWGGGVKLVGFGLGALYLRAVRRDALESELAAFAAPELRTGGAQPTAAGDLYSLGLLLWSLLADRPAPYDPRDILPIERLRRGVPRLLRDAVGLAVRVDPQERGITLSKLALLLSNAAGAAGRAELRGYLDEVKRELGDEAVVPHAAAFPPAELDHAPTPASRFDDTGRTSSSRAGESIEIELPSWVSSIVPDDGVEIDVRELGKSDSETCPRN